VDRGRAGCTGSKGTTPSVRWLLDGIFLMVDIKAASAVEDDPVNACYVCRK
jgi:hypothetical protein